VATLHESPGPVAGWRGHQLSRCPEEPAPPAAVRQELDLCWDLFHEGSGSDGMVELETTMGRTGRHPLVLLTLAQLYVMAGQGVPELLPTEGLAADTGDWGRNRVRLLARARSLLAEAGRERPDDAAVDYLLADAARAGGEFAVADSLVLSAAEKCTGGAGLDIMRRYQDLNRYPAELRRTPPPDYPRGSLEKGVAGKVVLDLLLDPEGDVRQVVTVSTPAADLAGAAAAAFRASEFAPARVGKYPVWSWLRVATNFRLADD